MPDSLIYIFSFLTAIAILVAIHEYGHFWVARKLGVKVLRFSIGFGKPLWSRTGRDGVEYVIAAIPLGGYVKMLDRREGDVPEAERGQEFMAQPIWKRNAIVVAGPLANFLFAIVAYWCVFTLGIPGERPVVGQVIDDTPAAIAGIEPDDEFISIADQEASSWVAVRLQLVKQVLNNGQVPAVLLRNGTERQVELNLSGVRADPEFLFDDIGIKSWRPKLPAVLDQVIEGGPAAAAGLRTGDRVIRADDQEIAAWGEWVAYVQQRPGKRMVLEVERDGGVERLDLIPGSHPELGADIGYAGVSAMITDEFRAELESHRMVVRYGPLEALVLGAQRTWDMSVLTLKMFGKIITGQASLKNIGGPILIAENTGIAVQIGLTTFLSVLAMVSIGLGVINLLPIPVLDGGHLLYYCAEWIKGSPVSERTQQIGQSVGLTAILALMTLAFYNDFTRLFG